VVHMTISKKLENNNFVEDIDLLRSSQNEQNTKTQYIKRNYTNRAISL
jgi:hypothetical protein